MKQAQNLRTKTNSPSMVALSEMKCEKKALFKCLSSLGYDRFAFVPSLGLSGDQLQLGE